MHAFQMREQLIAGYAAYVGSFIELRDQPIRERVDQEFKKGFVWPDPLIQLNPNLGPGEWIDELVDQGMVHPDCDRARHATRRAARGTGSATRARSRYA